jgi:hypothetical protein
MNSAEDNEFIRANGQATLDAAGFRDVTAVVGYFLHDKNLRLEVRLNGNPGRVTQARKLLPFGDNRD